MKKYIFSALRSSLAKTVAITLLVIFPATARTIDISWSQNEDPAIVGQLVAKRFADVPHPNFDGNPAPTQEITYPETCAWIGALRYADVVGDSLLMLRLEQRLTPIFGSERHLQPKPDHVDHTVFGAVPLLLYRFTGNPIYREMGLWYADEQWNLPARLKDNAGARRLADDGFSWQTRYWIDDMFMITSIQGQAYLATGDNRYINRAAHEMCSYLDSIQCGDGMFFHAAEAPFLWCRGNGWMAAGMTELLSILPVGHPRHAKIMDAYRKMMATLASHQKSDGLWGQLVDDPQAWSETSGSAMFTYAMIRGVRRGWLPEKEYLPVIRKAWSALVSHINDEGDIDGVCEGTNRTNDRDFYLHRRTLTGNMHGQAPILWCVTALLEPESADSDIQSLRSGYFVDAFSEVGAETGLYSVFRQLARLSAAKPLEDAGMRDVLKVIKSNRDCNDFTLNALLRMMYADRGHGHLNPWQKQIDERVLDFKYWWDDERRDTTYRCYHTENHQALYHTAELLAGQLYKSQRFADGKTGKEHIKHAKNLILPWLDYRLRFGFSEFLSTYYDVEVLLLTNLYDFAEDKEIRRKAESVLDLLSLDMALNNNQGYMAGASGRTYASSLINKTHVTAPLMWVLFGLGEPSYLEPTGSVALASSGYRCPEAIAAIANDVSIPVLNRQRIGINVEDAPLYGISYTKEPDAHLFWGMQEFIHPLVVATSKRISETHDVWPYRDYDRYISLYEKERAETGVATDRDRFAISEANLTTLRTPDYTLSTVADFRTGKSAYQHLPWMATIGYGIPIYTNHPGGKNLRQSPNYWAGHELLPRAAQVGNVAICVYNIPENHPTPYTHAYFPTREMDEVIESGNWTFGRRGNTYIALWSSTTAELRDDFRGIRCDLVAPSPQNIWICQMGSRDEHGDFRNFIEKTRSTNLLAEDLAITYGDISFGWKQPLTVNGVQQPLRNEYRYDNPYCRVPSEAVSAKITCNGLSHTILLK